jgi:hypothetical protein
VKSILIRFIISSCVESEEGGKVMFYLNKTVVLRDTFDIYFLQNVHHGTPTTGEIHLSIILRHFGLGQYNWIF